MRKKLSKLKNKILFGDYKISDIPNTCLSTIKAVKDLKFNFDQESVNADSKELITKYEEIALKEKRTVMKFLIPSIN